MRWVNTSISNSNLDYLQNQGPKSPLPPLKSDSPPTSLSFLYLKNNTLAFRLIEENKNFVKSSSEAK